jgi:CRISPR/Cas system-associated protein Cas10 (large subunit of type III CRISPR-Cas system)
MQAFSERTADAFLDEQFGNERCSFCGKRPDEINQMILRRDQRNHEVRICDLCINEFYKELPK